MLSFCVTLIMLSSQMFSLPLSMSYYTLSACFILLHFLYALLLTISSPVAKRFSLSYKLVFTVLVRSILVHFLFSLLTCQFFCINVLYASYSSVCIFNVYTFVLFFSLSLLFQCLFFMLFVSSVFTLSSVSFYTLSLTTSGIRLSKSKSLSYCSLIDCFV